MRSLFVTVCVLLTLCIVGAACVSASETEAVTLISWNDFYTYAKATTGTDKGVLTRVTGAEGDYSTYLQYEVQGITTAAENSRIIEYKDNGDQGMVGNVAAGDNMLLRMVVRAVGTEGKTKATSLISGNGATSKPTGEITIPTQWTEIFVPMTAGGNANYFTLRFGYFNQTIQIADFSLVNYGTAALTGYSQTPQKGGTAVSTQMFADARQLVTGQSLFVEPVAANAGDMVLLTLPVRSVGACGKVEVLADMGGTDLTMTYYVPVQWSNIYVPFQCDASLKGISVCVEGGTVQFGTVTLENKGSATFEELALQSGMWLLEDFDNIVLKESQGVKANNEDFYAQKGITSGRTADLVISSDGKYVYSIGDGMLTVTDITAEPKVISKGQGFGDVAGTSSLGDTRQICLLPGKGTNGADAVIFTARSYGAFIFDMADPANPVELAHYDALEMATGLAVYGDYAFVCSRFYGVEVVDLSDPAVPKHLCTILNEGGEVQSCKVVDGILYAGEYNNNCVSIYDVTDPLNYKKLGTCALNGRGDGMSVATVGDKTYLYAGTGHHSVSGLATSTPLSNLSYGQGNGLDIFDVTDPANPKWLSTSKIDGRFYNTSCDYWSAEYGYDPSTGKSYAYLVSTFNGMYVFDVTDPKAPVRVAHIALELLPDSPNYGAYGLTGSRAFIYNFDTTGENPVKYGAVGAVACIDGTICIAGVISDLYVLDYAKAFDTDTVSEDVAVAVSGDYYSFDAFSSMEGYASATVEGGQTYAVDTLGDYVYVAAGAKGIMIYDKELTLKGSLQTDDICYDLIIRDGKMYTAEGRCGAAIYTVDGLTLTETWRYKSTVGSVTTVRPSATGKFVAVHVGAVTGQIIRVSDKNTVVSVKATSQMYHHNVTGLVDGRYMGFWANSSSERWYDFGENDQLDTPVRVTDSSSGYTPRAAMTGGITAYGDQALATGSGGYYLYDPNTITSAEQAALTQIKPVSGYGSATKVSIYGKPTVAGNMLISCDRIYGRIYITDISNINQPVRLAAFGTREGTALVGNPDIAKVNGDNVYIPLGYMGVVKFSLSQFEPDGTTHTGGSHCLCNGQTVPNHSCEALNWQAWGDTEDELGTLPSSGNYYLVTDMTVGQVKINSGTLNLCLNGQTLTAKSGARIFHVSAGAKLNITDCRGSGECLATKCTGAGGVIYLDSNAASTASIYGGNLRGTVAVAQNGGLIYSAGGTVNIHGGTLRDGQVVNSGTTVKRGGNIRIDGKGTLTITGGLIANGSATGMTTSYGGNIYMSGSTTLNISGGIIEKGIAGGDNGGNIYVDSGTTVNITGGIIRDGQSSKRSYNIHVNSSQSAPSTVNMSAGLVDFDEALTCTGLGGNIYINIGGVFNLSGGTVKDGEADLGGNIYMNMKSLLNMTGGSVENGYASSYGGNVYINASADMTMSGGTIQDGEAKTRGGNVFLAYNADYEATYGRTDSTFTMTGGKLQDGVSKGNGGNLFVYYECTATVSGTASVTGGTATSHGGNICGNNGSGLFSNIYIYGADITGGSAGANGDNIYATGYFCLDLMGRDFSGVHTVISRFTCYDSATDTYDGAKAGKLTFGESVTAKPVREWKNPDTLKRYMTIENQDGSYQFHRFYLGITKMSLRPAVTGVGYKAVFAGTDEVKQQLSSYGYKLWVTEEHVAVASKEGSAFVSMKELTLRVQNFDVANYGDTPIYGSVYMELTDGTVIESSTYQYTLKDMVETIASNTDAYSETQMNALKAMCEKYAAAMSGWAIDNILNYAA